MILNKTVNTKIFILLCLSFTIIEITANSGKAFFPTINEPNTKELKSTSIEIGKTAIQLLQLGEIEDATNLLKLATQINPDEEILWIKLSTAQIQSDKSQEAIKSLKNAIKVNPNNASSYFTTASIYMNTKDYKNAIKYIKKGLSIDKTNERGYFQLGNIEIILKNYDFALIAFKKAIKINPIFWQSINNEGLIYFELNESIKAIERFEVALEISNDAEPMLALAIALFSADNKSNKSINLGKEALKLNPKYASTEYQSKQLWGKKLQRAGTIFFKTKEMVKIVHEAKKNTQ